MPKLEYMLLQVGKSYAGKANKGVTVKDIHATLEEGFKSLEALYEKSCDIVDSVKQIAITLRKLPTVDMGIPTVSCLFECACKRLLRAVCLEIFLYFALILSCPTEQKGLDIQFVNC